MRCAIPENITKETAAFIVKLMYDVEYGNASIAKASLQKLLEKLVSEPVAPPPQDMPQVVDLDGYIDAKGVRYVGKATRQDNGMYRCLANVGGSLCIVEVKVSESKD